MLTQWMKAVLLLGYFITVDSSEDFVKLAIGQNVYWFSETKTTFDKAEAQCSNIVTELAFFDTNTEYFQVVEALDSYVKDNKLFSIGIWVDFNYSVVDGGETYEHRWKYESFSDGVWNSHEPDSVCVKSPNRCCARINWDFLEFTKLRDAPCSVSYAFLCQCIDGDADCLNSSSLSKVVSQCSEGYTLSGVVCLDIDECSMLSTDGTTPCQQHCENTDGSYICSCNVGYTLQEDGHNCVDVDECSLQPSPCQHDCHNTDGSFYCSCDVGYELSDDQTSCQEQDKCAKEIHRCQQVCNNTVGSYTCNCTDGFTLNADGETCADIDECSTNSSNCQHQCKNSPGSFSCLCDFRFVLAEDGFSCVKQTTPNQCPCWWKSPDTCTTKNYFADRSSSENLLLDRKQLSAYKRTKISIQDQRPSIQAIGYSGVLLITGVICWVVVPDIYRALLFTYESKIKLP